MRLGLVVSLSIIPTEGQCEGIGAFILWHLGSCSSFMISARLKTFIPTPIF